jgi:hypothetical protein
VVLAKVWSILLALLVASPVTAPFRTFDDLTSSAKSRSALSIPVGTEPASIDDATLTNDPVLAKSSRFGSLTPLAAASSEVGLPLSGACSPLARTSRARAGRSHVSPVLRV